jgi:hypothetical protein
MSKSRGVLSLAVLLWGCNGPGEEPPTKDAIEVVGDDEDGDGFLSFLDGGQDCDDTDASVHPGAIEECDGLDQDCDGEPDNGAMDTVYEDADGDGYGNDANEYVGCEPPAGWVEDAGDCDDADSARNPGATELCNGLDDDCDEGSVETALIGEDSYSSVADAVAASQPGDVVELCDGVHPVSAQRIDHSLTLASISGDPALVTLQGDGQGSVLIQTTGTLTLQALTVTGGSGSGTPSFYDSVPMGGAVNAMQAELVLDNCVIESNAAVYGGGVATAQLTVTDTVFRDNQAVATPDLPGLGGAAFIALGGVASFTNTTFEGSGGDYGATIFTLGATTLTTSTFTGNVAVTSAGGIYAAATTITLVDTDFTSNAATYAGAVMLDGATLTADSDSVLSNNSAALLGGGALLYGSADTSWTGGVIQGNVSDLGGGIYADRVTPAEGGLPGSILVSDVVLEGNLAQLTATSSGGGLYAAGTPIEVSDISLLANSAVIGGGATIAATTDPTLFSGVLVHDNEADQGGGVALVGAEARLLQGELLRNTALVDGGGGVLLLHPASLDVVNTVFGNDADENIPDDVLGINADGETASFDLDGTVQTKCVSLIPDCP